MPYPGFFLGRIGEPLNLLSWLDLRFLEDVDSIDFQDLVKESMIEYICDLEQELLLEALECVAGADDTTKWQERLIRDQKARLI